MDYRIGDIPQLATSSEPSSSDAKRRPGGKTPIKSPVFWGCAACVAAGLVILFTTPGFFKYDYDAQNIVLAVMCFCATVMVLMWGIDTLLYERGLFRAIFVAATCALVCFAAYTCFISLEKVVSGTSSLNAGIAVSPMWVDPDNPDRFVDAELSAEYFQRSADRGNPDGTLALAHCYEQGVGVTKNEEKADELFARAHNLRPSLLDFPMDAGGSFVRV